MATQPSPERHWPAQHWPARHRPARHRPTWTRATTYLFSALATISVLAMLAIVVAESLPIWRHSGISLVTGKIWFFRAATFGALPMLYGTVAVATVAVLLAGPVAIGAAIFTAEVLPRRLRPVVKGTIELLAAVPSVVYGLLGILFLRDWIFRLLSPWDPLSGDTLLTGGVLLAVMILPTVMTLADDALVGVESRQRLAARGLGLNRSETAFEVTLPQARSGLGAALALGLGRALGETIAIFLVIGRQDNQWPDSVLSLAPLTAAGQTLTTKLGSSETFLAYGDPLHWGAMMGLSLVLLALTLTITLLARLPRSRAVTAGPPTGNSGITRPGGAADA